MHEMTLARENLRRGEQVSRASATAAPATAGPRRRLKMLQFREIRLQVRDKELWCVDSKEMDRFSSDIRHPDPNYSSSWDLIEQYSIPRQLLLLRQHRLSESAANRLNK